MVTEEDQRLSNKEERTRGRCRYSFALLLATGMVLGNCLRANLGLTIVCMVRHPYNLTNDGDPGGRLTNTSSIATTQPPDHIDLHDDHSNDSYDFDHSDDIASAITRDGEAVMCTSVPAFWINWAPKSEISTLQGISFAGGEVGIALVFPLSGVLCRSGIDGGWPSVFYVTGGLGLAWSLSWLFLSRDNPRDQPWISEAEKMYIEQTTKSRIHAKKEMPWRKMLKSRATWTLICTHLLYNYAYYMLQLQLPSYFNEVMHFDIQSNGLLVMMPYICTGLSMFLGGWMADVVIRKRLLSRDNTRKCMNTIGSGLHAVLMIILAQLDSRNQIPAVILLCLAGALNGLSLSGGFLATFVETALVHSATLLAVSNTIASIPGIVAPYVVSVLTPTGSQTEWQSAFYVAAAILLMSTIAFLFSTSAPQPWALPPAEDTTVVDNLNTDRTEDAL